MFFVYLILPLVVVAVFAFNDSMFPSLPWGGITFDWFFNGDEPRLGLFHDNRILRSIGVTHMRMITNNPGKRAGLEGYGLTIVERIALQMTPNEKNLGYLRTKQEKLGHVLDLKQ